MPPLKPTQPPKHDPSPHLTITTLWTSAILRYKTITGVDLDSSDLPIPRLHTTAEVISYTETHAGVFTKWRDDGGRMAKCREFMKKALEPVERLGGFVSGVVGDVSWFIILEGRESGGGVWECLDGGLICWLDGWM